MFFDEEMILDLRLNIMDKYVDKFVITEATYMHSGKSKKLIFDIKNCIKDKNYPILIDQEGGSVSRLNKIIDLSIFSQGFFGNFYKNDRKTFYDYYKIYIDTVCEIIKKVGININTVPVLDVRRKNSHSIIGNRSFSNDPSIVSKMGNLCINLYSKNKDRKSVV